MRAFITGGTGYIGSAVVSAFLRAGHQVTGLARSEEGAERLRALGVTPLPGDLRHPQGFAPEAAAHDAIVLLAQDRAAKDRVEADRAVVDALLAATRNGHAVSLIYTSNAFLLGDQGAGPLHEDDAWPRPPQWGAWRLEVERHVLQAGSSAVAAAIVRPGQVYGGGDGGSFPLLYESALEGPVAYVGSGENRWSLVHRDDLAELYVRAAEQGARGILHGVEDAPLAVGEIARRVSLAAGRGGATRGIPLEEARGSLGEFAEMLCLDLSVAARRARALGWAPRRAASPEEMAAAWREWREERS